MRHFPLRPAGPRLASMVFMHIEINADDAINRQARTYAEYRLFAALSQVIGTRRTRNASLVLRWTKSKRGRAGVLCTVTIESNDGAVSRLRAYGDHPYAAINRAVDRLRESSWPLNRDALPREMVAAE